MVNTRIGTSLAGFEVVERLGEGGSGVVYRVLDRDGHTLALKVAKSDLALSPRERARFLAEAESMKRVSHPSVIALVDAGELEDGSPYLVMPLLEGETLAKRLTRGPLSIASALRIASEIGDGIAAIHAAGMLHRDIKPENVFLVDPDQRAVVLDFGIARDVDGPTTTTTREGRMRGTPAYMAPERFFGAAPAAPSEVYELAVTLYVMLTGRLPWSGDDRGFDERLDPPPPEAHGATIPPHFTTVLMRALSTRPEARPQTIAAFLTQLEAREAVTSAERQTEDVTTRPIPAVALPLFETPPSTAIDVSRSLTRPSARSVSRVGVAAIVIAFAFGTAWISSRSQATAVMTMRDACLAPSCAGVSASLARVPATAASQTIVVSAPPPARSTSATAASARPTSLARPTPPKPPATANDDAAFLIDR